MHQLEWPEIGIKSSSIISKVGPKSSHSSFMLKELTFCFFKIAQKVTKYLGKFCIKIVTKNFQKSPNQVKLGPMYLIYVEHVNFIGGTVHMSYKNK